MDVRQDAFELIQDCCRLTTNLPFPDAVCWNATLAPSLSANSSSRRLDVGIGRPRPLLRQPGASRRRTSASVSRTERDFLATRAATSICCRREVKDKQGARMAHFDAALFQQLFDLVGKLHQPQQIADRGSRAAHRLGGRLMRETELLDQALTGRGPPPEGLRSSRWMFSMSAMATCRLIGHVADDRRNFRDSGHLRRPPAALAGDDFIALRFAGVARRQAGAPGWAAPAPAT